MSRIIESIEVDIRDFIEARGQATGAWRGQVHGGVEDDGSGGRSA